MCTYHACAEEWKHSDACWIISFVAYNACIDLSDYLNFGKCCRQVQKRTIMWKRLEKRICLTSLLCHGATPHPPAHSSIHTSCKPKQISQCCIWWLLQAQVTLFLSGGNWVQPQEPQPLQKGINNWRGGTNFSIPENQAMQSSLKEIAFYE